MSESLALKHRPRTFDDVAGQRQVTAVLRAMVAAGTVPAGLLFHGLYGSGKTTTARILAAALNCDTPPGPCGHCVSCKAVADGTSTDLHEIDAASHGLVDDIRQLRQQVLYGVGGRHRVVVLDEAQSVSAAGFNAMLKMIEEPPPGTVFVVVTTELHKIPKTVRSRLMKFPFTRIAPADIAARLTHIAAAEQLSVEPDLITALAEHTGSPRDAVMTLDQLTRAGITTLAGWRRLTGHTDHGPAILTPLAAGDVPGGYQGADAALYAGADPTAVVNDLQDTLRDLLILHAGGTLSTLGAALAARQRLAARLDTATVFTALKVLWDYKTKLRGDDPRADLSLAVAMLGIALHPAHLTATPATAGGGSQARLTLSQMAQQR